MKISEIIKITNGKLLSGNPDTDIDPSKISTDSRTIGKGEFFIALKGPNFDGSDFMGEVFKKGAIGAIVSAPGPLFPRPRDKGRGRLAPKLIIQVKDSTKALQDIAADHRRKFKIPVIAVTGSNGKTTVKDMIASVMSTKYNVLKSEGTNNNHIGVPQTLLKLNPGTDVCVLELGTNHRGEIRNLSAISLPTIAVMTNIGPSHLEFLGDLEGVYEAKREILEFLDEKGVVVLNGDDRFLLRIREGKRKEALRYGFRRSNDFVAEALPSGRESLTFVVNNRIVIGLKLFGPHNVYNALAAIAVASRFGIDNKAVREALFNYRPASMRLDHKEVNGINVLDDAYNSNPSSMTAALQAIRHYPANARWVVAGDMLELGDEAVRFHKEAGESIARSGIDGLITFGELSKHMLSQAVKSGMDKERSWHCTTHEEIAGIIKKVTREGDAVLLKGSRGMRMEKVLEKLNGR